MRKKQLTVSLKIVIYFAMFVIYLMTFLLICYILKLRNKKSMGGSKNIFDTVSENVNTHSNPSDDIKKYSMKAINYQKG